VTSDVTLFPASATVTGSVTSDGGGSTPGPLLGAGLILTSSDNTYKTTSGAEGAYQFDGVAPGDYVLSAQYAGLTTVFKSVKVPAGTTTPIVVPSFELVTPAKALSSASIVGFVNDGTNPSNTICPSTPGKCTLTFTLHAQDGTAVALSQSSLATAEAGPTAYTLTPSSGIEPGLYKLTIGASYQGATNYLPVTVGVQVPLSGIASAPAVSLYPANTIKGSIQATNLVKGFTDDPAHDGTGASVTNCVYAVPAGTAAPDVTKPCSENVLPASNCLVTGAPGPAYAEIAADGSFELGDLTQTGSHSAVCDGTYDVYVAIENPWFSNAIAKVTVTVAHGETTTVPPIGVPEKAQLSLTVKQMPLDGSAAKAFDTVQTIDITCTDPAGTKATISPDSVTTDGTNVTTVRIGGFADGFWTCTGSVTSSGDYPAASTGSLFVFSAQNASVGPVAASMLFTQRLGTVFGQVSTSWSGTPTGVGGGTVSITGVTSYSGSTGQTSTVDIATAADGCFAITPDGTMPPAASIPASCPDLASDPGAVKELALIQNKADFSMTPPDGQAPPGYLTPATLTGQAVTKGGLVTITVDPEPVTLSGLVLQTDPVTNVGLSTFSRLVTKKPSGAGNIDWTVDDTTGAITWTDDKINVANEVAPGTYTIEAQRVGYVTTDYTFTCAPAGGCTVGDTAGSGDPVSSSPFVVDQLGNLTVDLGEDGSAPITDATVTLHYVTSSGATSINRTTTTGGPVTFDDLTPSRDLPTGSSYSIEVKAAGYQFGNTTGTSGTKVDLDCGSGATDTATIDPGASPTCTATPKRDGAIAGKVILVYGSTATTMVPPAGTTVTAESGGTAFTATTKADGTFRVTGTSTTQGMDDSTTWALKASLSGYSDGTQNVTINDVTADTEIDGTAADPCTDTTNICLTVKTVTVKVTVDDDSGNPADGLTAKLTGGSYGGPYTATASGNVYTFTGVVPDHYTLTLAGDPYTSTYTPTSIDVTVTDTGEQDVTPDAVITRGTSTVSGTVEAAQGQSGITAPLSGATVCIVAAATVPTPTATSCSSSNAIKGTDGNTVSKTTGGDGTFTFTTVPNTPSGDSYYLVVVPPFGYSPYVDTTGFTADFTDTNQDLTGFVLQPDRVLRSVTVKITPSDSGDDLSGWTATLASPSVAGWNYSATGSPDGSAYDFAFAQVPAGCWTFSLTLPADHFGSLTQVSAPSVPGMSCTTPQLSISDDTSVSTATSYTLNEYQPKVKITLDPLALDTAPSEDVTVTVSAGTTYYTDTLTVPAAGLNQTLPVWVSTAVHPMHVKLAPKDSNWTVDNADTVVQSTSPTATATLTETGSTVTVSLNPAAIGEHVTLTQGATVVDLVTNNDGDPVVFHDIPYGVWTAKASGYTDLPITVNGTTESATLVH
jgi:hypothetical protein